MGFVDKTGSSIPFVIFKIRQDYEWISKTTDDFFKHKKVVLFALPGAFTPTCSSVHLPSYDELYPAFRAHGIDDVICLAVNDSFVLNEWKKRENVRNVTMLPDGNGEFTKKLGFLVDKSDLNFGMRSWRYSMLVEDRKIIKMFIEPEEDGDPYGVSSAEKMLHFLNPHEPLPESVTVFSRHGCLYCAKAKELLAAHHIPYDELFLHEHFSIKTLKAVSAATSFPQIFINGELVGGTQDLEELLDYRALKRSSEGPRDVL
jgi:glutathione amide-dependent peroxidase